MLNLDMRQLEYFVTAAAAGSYASAAKKLFISPQAISKGVQVLEHVVGIELFERGPNGIALTEFGETFYEESAQVLQSLERLQGMAKRYQRGHRPSLSVGIHSLCFKEHGGTIDWSDLLEFHEVHRDIEPSFVEMRGDAIMDSIADGALDFGITVPPCSELDDFESILLKSFDLAAIVPADDGYFESNEVVTIQELVGGQLILFPEEDSFNEFYIEEARKEGASVSVSSLQVRADSDIDFTNECDHRLYAVRPYQHATRTTHGDSVRILPILNAEGDEIAMPLHILWKRGRSFKRFEQSFVDMITNLYLMAKTVRPENVKGPATEVEWR